ncbi:hypothetical protein V5O48_006723 [Marasmius crinis-equi]|uniref:F-box domain-containing protein n=1 Tax=Marasmius crinis-equi TaxID=585013 RepID=A0ABR3FIY8_9AGAR
MDLSRRAPGPAQWVPEDRRSYFEILAESCGDSRLAMEIYHQKEMTARANRKRATEPAAPIWESCGLFLDLPNEVWLAIFNQVGHPLDLFSCLLACKRFKGLAIKALYRTIHYHSLASFNTLRLNSFAEKDEESLQSLAGNVRTAVLSTGGGYGPFGSNLRDWFNSNKRTFTFVNQVNSPVDFDHANTWSNWFHPSFAANITKLVFISTKVSAQFAPALGGLTALRELYFHGSRVEGLDVRGNQNLTTVSTRMRHLTDLRVWNHFWFRSMIYSTPTGRLDTVDLILAARSLETLYIDWDPAVAYSLIEKVTPAQTAFLTETVPHIRKLHLRLAYRTADQREKDRRDFTRLGVFLRACTSLEELHIVSESELSPVAGDVLGHIGLQNLRSYSGPAELLSLLLPPTASALESVCIPYRPDVLSRYDVSSNDQHSVTEIDYRNPAADVLANTFCNICAPNLRRLTFYCKEWHHEVLLCLTQCFPRLKALKIGYSLGYVEEVDWISMGGVHLEQFPELATFYLYRQQDHTYLQSRPKQTKGSVPRAGTELLSDVFAAWKRYTPSLDEVSFDQDTVWTRGRVAEGRKVYDEDLMTNELEYDRKGWDWSGWRMSERHDRITGEEKRDAEKDREVDLWLA